MIDALFFSRITFSFFKATSAYCASDAVTMVAYVGCCVGGGTGGGGGYCVQKQQTLHPALLTAGKTGPPDRPTDGHHKAAIFFGGAFLLFFCLRLAPFEPQESNQQNNNKNEPLFLYCSMPLLSYIITTLLTMYYNVFCFVMFGCSAWRLV